MNIDMPINRPVFDTWHEIVTALREGHKGGVSVTYGSTRLDINAEFIPSIEPNAKPGEGVIVGGGVTMSPTQFGERLDRELKALVIEGI